MPKKPNRANKVYWNDIRAAVKASGLPIRQVRAAWREKAFTKTGERIPRAKQVRKHVQAARKQRAAVKEFKRIVGVGGGFNRGGWGGTGADGTDPDENTAKTDAISLYGMLGNFGGKGYRIKYATPGASGDVKPEAADDSGKAIGLDVAREIMATMHTFMNGHPQNNDSPGWKFNENFLVSWNDIAATVAVKWIGPEVGGE